MLASWGSERALFVSEYCVGVGFSGVVLRITQMFVFALFKTGTNFIIYLLMLQVILLRIPNLILVFTILNQE